ncbi:polysaccharide biosynthesis C-terminal domain-containing protein, partial [Burkholderia sp. E168m23]
AALVNLFAIPRLGLYGALVGLAAGYLAAAAVNFYYIRFKLRT